MTDKPFCTKECTDAFECDGSCADLPETPVPQHHTSGYMRAEGTGDQGAVTEDALFTTHDRIEFINETYRRSGHIRGVLTLQVDVVANAALNQIATLRADRDEALKDAEHWKLNYECLLHMSEVVEVAHDAYKAALEEARFVLDNEMPRKQKSEGYAQSSRSYEWEWYDADDTDDMVKSLRAALSRDSTANAPAIADSSRDDKEVK